MRVSQGGNRPSFPARSRLFSNRHSPGPGGAFKEQAHMADPKLDRLKAIDGALSQIERQFGKGAIMRLGQREILGVEAISTGSISVDSAIGIGGFPRGRVVEVY